MQQANDAFQTKALTYFPRYFHDSIPLYHRIHQTAKEVHRTKKMLMVPYCLENQL